MQAWLPLPTNILNMVVRQLPSPSEAGSGRIDRLWPEDMSPNTTPALADELDTMRDAVATCGPASDDVRVDCVAPARHLVPLLSHRDILCVILAGNPRVSASCL